LIPALNTDPAPRRCRSASAISRPLWQLSMT
jgi:hypothetical protein